jgi:NADH-quinone oxidoreductase subunit M
MLSLAGMFRVHWLYAVIGASGVVLGAWYLLTMLQHLLFGPLKEPAASHDPHHGHGPILDMNLRELLAIAPVAAACLVIGVKPQPLIESMRPEIEALASLYEPLLAANETATAQATLLPTNPAVLADATPASR